MIFFRFREAQVLADDQLDFVKKTSEKIYELLSEIPPRGREFVKCVKHILKVKFHLNCFIILLSLLSSYSFLNADILKLTEGRAVE